MLTKKPSEKVTDEEMDEMIEIVEGCLQHHTGAYSGTNRRVDCGTDMSQGADSRSNEDDPAGTCFETNRETDHGLPQVAGAERQGFSKPRNKLRTRRAN